EQKRMLGVIGAGSIEELLVKIPAKVRLPRPLGLVPAMAETDLIRHLKALAGKNADADSHVCFMGAGSYDHYVPSPINHLVSRGVHPLYKRVTATYCEGPGIRLRDAAGPDGVTDLEAARKVVGAKTAALVIQTPNFYGCLEDVAAAAEIAHGAGALLVVVADPVNLGVLEAPGKLGADIVIGEGQGLGVPLSFGGPNLGVFAAKKELVRRMPGRLVGATVDSDGHRGRVLTLQ